MKSTKPRKTKYPWRETEVGKSFKVPHVSVTGMINTLRDEGIVYRAEVTTKGVWMTRMS